MLSLVQKLCSLPGIPGREEAVRQCIEQLIAPHCQYEADALGNLIAFKKGRKTPAQKRMLCAHMDEVGFVVTFVTDEGLLKFAPAGGADPRVVFSGRVLVGDGVPGVIAAKAVHMVSAADRSKAPELDDLYIDIGVQSKEEALNRISLFAPVVFDSDFVSFGDGLIKAKALDDRVGCALLVDLICSEEPLLYDTWFAFTVQEEVGLRGAKAAAYGVNPDIAIVVEATTAADIHGVSDHRQVCELEKGPVISFMDNRTIYDKKLYDEAFAAAEANGISVQPKRAVAGGNDAGAIHISRWGVRTLSVSLPCRYLHSPVCVISEKDLEDTRQLLSVLLRKEPSLEIFE